MILNENDNVLVDNEDHENIIIQLRGIMVLGIEPILDSALDLLIEYYSNHPSWLPTDPDADGPDEIDLKYNEQFVQAYESESMNPGDWNQ